VLRLAFCERVTQQPGVVRGGVVASPGDSTGGYAAMTMLDAGLGMVSVEYKVNVLASAVGDALVAAGQVIRAGRRLPVATTEVEVDGQGRSPPCTLLHQTLAPLAPRAS